MAGDAAQERVPRPLLTLGRVDRVRIQVGYRALPDSRANEQFLLDLEVPEDDDAPGQNVFDESRILAALEPVLHVGAGPRRHYSLHEHRWHTSWGVSPGALEIGLLVTTGTRLAAPQTAHDEVARSFRALLEMAGGQEAAPISRAAAVQRARSSAATAYAVEPGELSLRTEEHHGATNSWRVGLRGAAGDEYDVLVGLVDGYAGSVRVLHEVRTEVSDSVGSE